MPPGDREAHGPEIIMKFCGLTCKYASFPKDDAVDGSRSCRTFIALYCSRRRGLVHKNLPCGGKREADAGSGRARKKK